MQYVPIKQEIENGKEVYIVNAISLKNTNKSVVQKIPHPLGTDALKYSTLEEAKEAIARAGFSYVLPNGKKVTPTKTLAKKILEDCKDYDNIIYNLIRNKVNSSSQGVAQAAILALAEFPSEETFDILFEKIGEENELIRKNAIAAICRYGNILQNRIIEALEDENWVTKNSAITCIKNLMQDESIDVEKFIIPLTKSANDTNPIVQASAISTLALVYNAYKRGK
ncbi:HEAT repeat domain-containing protein [bacterium]|nr:HEAT repeat domain-containing protein [bacterium]